MKLRVQLQCKNLHEYLKELSPEILDRLYNHPATCLAVYRELPPLAKNYVMRMLFLDQPLPQAAVALWVKKDSEKDHDQCVSVLSGLRLWHSQQLQGGLQGNVLNPVFKDNLRIALLGGAAVSQDLSQLLIQAGLMRTLEMLPVSPLLTRGMDLVEILSFLFQLSFSTLGRDYSVEGMSESLLTFLQHLREFGL
ncbi:unnamed protein product, partial [Coregonus sp. 'balchen']